MKPIIRMAGCVALLAFCTTTLSNAQQLSLQLDDPVELHVRQATLMFVLDKLSVERNIPVGIEFSSTEKNEPKLEINVKNAPLVDVLNLIIQQEPTYIWELRNGVINFIPVKDRDPFF